MAVVSAAVCSLPPAKEVGETFVDLAVTACVIPPRRRFCRLPPLSLRRHRLPYPFPTWCFSTPLNSENSSEQSFKR